ncbi:hypothetical protein [Streptomyces wuyuanensis]|uniref:hypothetical protein n=1 Tax=Streptomyces wuyuanensis TaxID=1196353 RepID=UPI003428B621
MNSAERGLPTSAESPSREVRLHRLGTPATDDPVVFETPLRQLAVAISSDGRWLSVSCAPGAQAGNAIRLADLGRSSARRPPARPGAPPDQVAVDTRGNSSGRMCNPSSGTSRYATA